jgi:hypothetical protein
VFLHFLLLAGHVWITLFAFRLPSSEVPPELPLVIEVPLADGQDVGPLLFADFVLLIFIFGLESELFERILDFSEFLELIIFLHIFTFILLFLFLFGLFAGLLFFLSFLFLHCLGWLLLLFFTIVAALISRVIPNMAKALLIFGFWTTSTSSSSSAISF